jgi:hypothetical protein
MPLPNWAAAELLVQESGTPIVAAVTLYHPAWGAPIRLVRDTQALTSRGETFNPAWFDFEIVNDTDSLPRATIVIPNVDQEIGEMVQQIDGEPVQVTIEAISLAYPDEPIYAARRLELRGVQMNAVTVSGDLASRDYSTEAFGKVRVTPRRFPALFRGRR